MKLKHFYSVLIVSAAISACAPTPVYNETQKQTSLQLKNLPEAGQIHTKHIGQVLVSQTETERESQKVLVLTKGFKREPTWSSSGYSIEIAPGAKGVMIDDYSACFNNEGFNSGLPRSKGKSNFCFYDKNKDGQFEKAMLDSFNSWGQFDIDPTLYKVEDVALGTGRIVHRRELLLSQGTMIEYREFDGEATAPMRTEVLRIAIEPTRIIEKHGAKIRVLSVSDNEIKYELLSHFAGQKK